MLPVASGMSPAISRGVGRERPEPAVRDVAASTRWRSTAAISSASSNPRARTSRGSSASAPFGWHRDFADARARLRDWVAASGTRRDRDRPTRQTPWPGEDQLPQIAEQVITDRDADFVQFVLDQVAARQAAEDAFFASIDMRASEAEE